MTKNKQDKRLFLTSAPASYDYPYTTEVSTGMNARVSFAFQRPGEGKLRLVAINSRMANYQTARYTSGLYPSIELVIDASSNFKMKDIEFGD